MSGSSEFLINEARYQWCVRAFSLLRKRLGVDINLRSGANSIEAGQIFLFNHFARFETIIPQYFMYQEAGAYCRCVATHELFEGNAHFAKFLWSLGGVPNNHPGLLPFLAAEILRGRKAMFFPEGAMIKDRGMFAPSGLWPALSKTARHHQGAAALALVLETFKQRILSVQEAGDSARLGRWVAALGLADIDALIAAAKKPTLIVPGNITFFPIHTGDNFLRKAAEFFAGNLAEPVREELLIEGNLLLRHTDMDIRLGEPIDPGMTWSAADRAILARAFEEVDSLPDLFGLKDKADRWIDRMAAAAMGRKTRQLRDTCMAAMYAQVTVNLNHLASRLMLRLYRQGETEIDRGRFHRMLYRVLKDVQKLPGVHLHGSVSGPETYDGIHDGSNGLFAQLLETAASSNLLAIEADRYRFLPGLGNGATGRRDPRLENVVRVYANEIASLATVCACVDRARPAEGAELAWLLFDDELRAHAQSKRTYSAPRHGAVNGLETAADNGEPYLLVPDRQSRPGVVLVHGFLAIPAQLKELGQRLADRGHPVLGVRLRGHGTSPWDLRDRNWQDWLHSVRRGYEIMSQIAGDVLLAGFATGASLALQVAAARPQGLAGVVAVSAPLKFRDRNLAYAPLIHGINRLAEWVYAEDGIKPFHVVEPEHSGLEYRHMPVRGLIELRKAAEELERVLPDIVCPVHIVQATDDPIVDPDSARIIMGSIGSAQKTLHMIDAARHGILNGDAGDVQGLVVSLLGGFAVSRIPPLPAVQFVNPAPKISAAITRMLAPFLGRLRPRPTPPPPEEPYPWEQSYPSGVDWHATITPKPLTELFDNAVRAHASKMCMSFRGKHYRYHEVGKLVDRAAKGFQGLGVGRGIKVALMLPNCPYAVICFYAVLKAGGTVVNINPLYSAVEIERQVNDADARILVSLDVKMLYDKVAGLGAEAGCLERLIVCPMKGVLRFTEKLAYGFLKGGETAAIAEDDRHVFFERLIANDGRYKRMTVDPLTDVAVLQYTGGTTGFSKGAQLTHANLFANAAQLALWAPGIAHGREKSLAALPLFHAFGMTAVMNLSLWIGAELLLLARFDTTDVLATIDRERPAIFIGVPTMFSALIEHRDIGSYDLSSLKFCISGGAALAADIQQRFEKLSGCKLIEGYGLSEAAPVCTVNPLDGGKPGSVGLPLPGTVIEIVALDDPQRLLPPSERGEICVTGPQVMAGYANRAQENVDALRGGRLHTGDVGYLDADGYLHIVDRIKDLILSSGFNVYPRHVEDAILLHPAVAEAAVRGVADSHRGEIVKAYVKLREGMTLSAADLREFLNQRLAPFEVPRRIEFRASLPHTFLGKISKKDLEAGDKAQTQLQNANS